MTATCEFKVTDFGTDQTPVCDFPLVNNWSYLETVSELSLHIGLNYQLWHGVPLSNCLVWAWVPEN